MSKRNLSVAFGETIGEFFQGIVNAINIVFSKYRVTVFELLLFGLAIVEAMQGIFAKGNLINEASRGAKSAGHIGLFLVGMVAGLVYAKEFKDIGKAVEKREFWNMLIQLLQAIIVLIVMSGSIIGQTMIVLASYDLADEFMNLFRVNMFSPLWGMLEYGSFATMTVYVAYLHFIILAYVGLKQLGEEESGAYVSTIKPSVTPAATTTPAPISFPPALSPTFLNELKEMYKTRSIGFSDFMFSNMIKEKDAQKLVPFVKDSHFNDQSDILKAILKYFNVTTDYSAELIRYESKLNDLLK
jgi:hypothetical protein